MNIFKSEIPFYWRNKGTVTAVTEMTTDHLFYTIRMIWNNTMPEPVPDNPKFYSYGPNHSDEYLAEALKHLSAELFTRDDIKAFQEEQLEWMIERSVTLANVHIQQLQQLQQRR